MSNSNSSNTEKPGEGIRSLKSSTAFRVINFELYAKPVSIIVYYVRLCYISTALTSTSGYTFSLQNLYSNCIRCRSVKIDALSSKQQIHSNALLYLSH